MNFGGLLRRILAAAVLAAAVASTVGCAPQAPPPVSEKVAAYYSNPPTPKVAAPADPAVMLKSVRETLRGPGRLSISVLGDSTGNERGEWVDLYAQHLAKYGTVTVHFWDSAIEAYGPRTETYPGPARQIVVWSGSMPGASQKYGLENLNEMQPERPSFVMYNYGHNQVSDGASAATWRLATAIEERWGKVDEVVILQNPSQNTRQLYSARSVGELQGFAARFGRPVIDVQGAFTKAGNLSALLGDDVHPNPAGSRLWADTVIGVLG